MSEKQNPTSFLTRALADGHAKLTGEGKQQKITYIAADYTERFSDPEEQVRAEFWAELIYRYEYKPQLIGFEVIVPRRTSTDRADLVVYEDTAKKSPYIVIECKRADITDSEFLQAVEQACGNRANLGAPYAGVVAGVTRRVLDFTDRIQAENRDIKAGAFDLILTNPPFGSVVKQAEKGNDYLDQYELRRYLSKNANTDDEGEKMERDAKRGAKAVKQRSSVKTEILFLERVHTYLKPGTGRIPSVLSPLSPRRSRITGPGHGLCRKSAPIGQSTFG